MRRIQHLITMCMILLLTIPVLAQVDLDETYEWENGITMNYPDDWDTFVDDNDISHFVSDDTDIFIIFDSYDADDGLAEYIEDAFDDYKFETSTRFDDDDVFIDELEDFDETASYYYTEELGGDEFQRAIFAIPLDDETIAIAIAVPLQDDELEELDTVLAMLATLTGTGESIVEDDISYEWDNGYEITLGDDWQVDGELFSNGTIEVRFYFFEIEDDRTDTRARYLREIFAETRDDSSLSYDEDQLVFVELENDENALEYDYADTDYTPVLVAFSPDDEHIVIALGIPSDGENGNAVLNNIEDMYLFVETLE